MSEDWISPDPDWWKPGPFDPEDWLPPDPYEDMFGPWGPGGPYGLDPENPFEPLADPPRPPWGWGPDGPVYTPPTPPPVEPPPPAAVAGGAALETVGVFALAALAPILLVAAGLYLPARAWGHPSWYWPWEDPCDDDFTELSIAFKELADDAQAFAGKPSRRGASDTLAQASYVIRLCQQFLRECPKNSHAATARQMLAAAEQARDDCLDYLAKH